MAEELTHLKKMLNPNFLGDWSLPGGLDVVLTIKGYGTKEGWNEKEQRKVPLPVIYFEEEYDWAKPFVPNATNIEMIAQVTGTKFQEKTIGCKIQIGLLHGKWFGKEQDALRVRNVKSDKLAADYKAFVAAIPNCKSRADITALMNANAVFKPYSSAIQQQIKTLWASLPQTSQTSAEMPEEK